MQTRERAHCACSVLPLIKERNFFFYYLTLEPVEVPSYGSGRALKALALEVVDRMLSKNTLELVSDREPAFYSCLTFY